MMHIYCKQFALFFSTTLAVAQLFAQDIPQKGIPFIENFKPMDFGAYGKIWDISTAKNGIVYFASDNGLLEFDGQDWSVYKGSKGNTRSLLVLNDSVIYSGSDFDFGVYTRNKFLGFDYKSLYPFISEPSSESEEFWQIHELDGDVFFVSANNIYLYKNQQFTKIPAMSHFSGSYKSNGNLYFVDERYGLYIFRGRKLEQIFPFRANQPLKVAGVLERNGQIWIATQENGLYVYTNEQLQPQMEAITPYLERNRIFSFAPVGNAYMAIGTILDGVYIVDFQGNLIQHINKKKGLDNNTILSLNFGPSGKLWMGTDQGLSAWHLRSNTSYFFDYTGTFGTTKTALLNDGTFYLGTNQGLYKQSWTNLKNTIESTSFSLIPGTEGQVWALEEIDGQVYVGHNNGLFRIENANWQQVHDEPGVWNIHKINENQMLTGNYNGVSVFEKKGDQWVFDKKIDLILGSCNELVVENERIFWVHIPNFAVMRVELDANMYPKRRTIFEVEDFAGKLLELHLTQQGITVSSEKANYFFDSAIGKFRKTKMMLPTRGVKNILPGINTPSPIGSDFNFFPIQNGFALQNKTYKNQREKLHVLEFRSLEAYNNTLAKRVTKNARIPYDLNNVRIHFIAPVQDNATYQYLLDGYSEEWSKWSAKTEATFLNLDAGNYVLRVRAKAENLDISSEIEIPFSIACPWYMAWYAYLLYFLLAIALFLGLRRWQEIRLKKQKKELLVKQRESLLEQAAKHKELVMQQKQEQLVEEQNMLKKNLRNKTIELAQQAKENNDKNRLITNLREKIRAIEQQPTSSKKRLSEMRRMLDGFTLAENQTFEIQMDELHQAFFKILKDKFPKLSVYDLRLSAYLKIGLNSKEIAEIMQVLPSSINVSRSRLRKKLKLNPEDDLYEFLNDLDSEELN